MTRIENVRQGKYYADDSTALRVDGFDRLGDPFGLSVTSFDGCVNIYQNTDLDYHFYDDNKMREITRQEFEKHLKEAKKKFLKMIDSELFNVVS